MELPPNPSSDILACWIGEVIDVVQYCVIQLLEYRTKRILNISKIDNPSGFRTYRASYMYLYAIRVSMQFFTLVSRRNIWQPMSGLKPEGFENFHALLGNAS